jgi:hypothetical protein
MGAGRRRPVSGGTPCGSVQKKKRAGKSFSLHVGASAGEETSKKTTTVEIDVGGRLQWAAVVSSIWAQWTLWIRIDTRVSLRRKEEVKERG